MPRLMRSKWRIESALATGEKILYNGEEKVSQFRWLNCDEERNEEDGYITEIFKIYTV